jgi:hypothetical protein
MEMVKIEREVPKEFKEMLDSAVALIKHFKGGGSLEGAAAFLPALMKGVEGVDKVPAEVKAHAKECALYGADEVLSIFE